MAHVPSASAQLLQLPVCHVSHSLYWNYICMKNVKFLYGTIVCLLYVTVDTLYLKHARRGVPGLNQYWFLAQGLRHFWPELIPRCGNITIYYKWVCSPFSCGLLPKRNARILSCFGITHRRNSSHGFIVDTTSPRENLSSGPPTSETISSPPNHRDKPILQETSFAINFSKQRTTEAKTRPRLCAGWSLHLPFPCKKVSLYRIEVSTLIHSERLPLHRGLAIHSALGSGLEENHRVMLYTC